uniref:Uncharacterized protein n=1 Tax=Arundo donax TaxID=35708 RepID=A0A0A9D5N8_ARUDO
MISSIFLGSFNNGIFYSNGNCSPCVCCWATCANLQSRD